MSRLSKNILYNLLGQGTILALGFVAARYVFARLGGDALGIIYFSLTLNAVIAGLLDMGISATLVREVAGHFETETEYTRNLVRTASLFYWGAYFLLALGVYLAAPWLVQKWVSLKSLDPQTAIRALRILGFGVSVSLPRSLYASILGGLQRMEFTNLLDVGTTGLQQLGVVLLLVLGGGFSQVAWWLTACFVLGLVAYSLISARLTLAYGVATLLCGALAMQLMGQELRRCIRTRWPKWVKNAEHSTEHGTKPGEDDLPRRAQAGGAVSGNPRTGRSPAHI